MDTCTIEVGLLKKKPCGHPAATHCATCEQPLCAQHAIAQVTEAGKKSGKFMCKECNAAQKEIAKTGAAAPAKKPAAPAPAPEAKPAPAAKAATAPKEALKPDAPEEKKYDGGIDFTPTKK